MSYHKIFKDIKSPYLSIFSLAIWGAAILLQSGFTTLITPIPYQSNYTINGTEMNLMSDSFLDWVNRFSKNLTTCDWGNYTIESPEEHISLYYPVCPYFLDQVAFATAGMVNAVDNGFFSFSTFTRVTDSIFNGSTGGVLPMGDVGIAAFQDDLTFPDISWWTPWNLTANYTTPYNYTLIQQGVTAEVSCQDIGDDTPISRYNPEASMNVTNSYTIATMAEYTFTYDTENFCPPPGRSFDDKNTDTFVTPINSSLGVYMCQPDVEINEWTLYLSPYDDYTKVIPNLACAIKPKLTDNLVTYESTGFMIEQSPIADISNSTFVPFDIIYAIPQAFLSSYSSTVCLL